MLPQRASNPKPEADAAARLSSSGQGCGTSLSHVTTEMPAEANF